MSIIAESRMFLKRLISCQSFSIVPATLQNSKNLCVNMCFALIILRAGTSNFDLCKYRFSWQNKIIEEFDWSNKEQVFTERLAIKRPFSRWSCNTHERKDSNPYQKMKYFNFRSTNPGFIEVRLRATQVCANNLSRIFQVCL